MAAERKPTAPVATKQPFSDELVEKFVLRQTEADVPDHEAAAGDERAADDHVASDSTSPTPAIPISKPRPLPAARFRNGVDGAASSQKLEPQIRDIRYATLWSRFVANLFDSCVAGMIGAIVLMLVIYIAPANTIEPIFGSNCFSEIGPALLIYCFILSAASWSVPLIIPVLWFFCMSASMPFYVLPEGMSPWTTTWWLGFLTLAMIVPQTLYSAFLESSSRRATLGKRLLGILVCNDDDKSQINFQAAVDRYLVKAGSFVTLLSGFLVAWDSPRRLCLHDRMSGTVVLEGHATEDGLTTDPQHLLKLSKQQQIVSGMIFLSLLIGGFRFTFHEIIEEQSLRLTAIAEEQLPDKTAAIETWLSIYSTEAAKTNVATANMALSRALELTKANFPQGSPESVSELLHIAMVNHRSDSKSSKLVATNLAVETIPIFRTALNEMEKHPGMTIRSACLMLPGDNPSDPEDVWSPFGLFLNQKLSESDIRMMYAHLLSHAQDWTEEYSQLSKIARTHLGDDVWWRGELSRYTSRSVDFAHMVNTCTLNMMRDRNEPQAVAIERRLALLKPLDHLLRPWQINEIR